MAGRRNAGFRSVRHGDVVPRDDVIAASREEGRQICCDHSGLLKSIESKKKKSEQWCFLMGARLNLSKRYDGQRLLVVDLHCDRYGVRLAAGSDSLE